ncbi:hypothetical protein [Aquibacillus salsiterrae]|uniref:DUF3990 domain-containing protein n=1 Tax=Aquibacillus salsiterrae TaxID=2950439 RepID=A0A9X3WK13_9BACI|nr:hypothetical protein [Aquibacillus salsiterrae]MDC3418744.1 hypothetical protein [Aquibacillus salsiterrae]
MGYTLYHGNTKQAIEDMVENNSLLEKYKSSGDKHYLGDGFYFYNDLKQAEHWAKMKVTRNQKYKGQKWAVLECIVEYEEENCLDLDQREEQEFFFYEMRRLDKQIKEKELDIDEYCDAYFCNHLGGRLDLVILSKTFVYKDKHKIFPPLFSNVRSEPYSKTRHFRTEKQYVLRDKSIVSNLRMLHNSDLKEVK